MQVVLDAGHGLKPSGEFDPGAWSQDGLLCEHDLAVYTVGILSYALEGLGAATKVITGPTDTKVRGAFNCEMFVSVHFNAFDKKVDGSEALVMPDPNKKSILLAESLAANCATRLGLRNRGSRQGDWKVFKHIDDGTAGAIVEPFFMDTRGRSRCFKDARHAAFAILNAIVHTSQLLEGQNG